MSFISWDEYTKMRESGEKNIKSEAENADTTGVDQDFGHRDAAEYKKLLDFLKGKANTQKEAPKNIAIKEDKKPAPVEQIKKDSPSGWFVVDEASKGFWFDGAWTSDEDSLKSAVIPTEEAAKALALQLGAIVLPASALI